MVKSPEPQEGLPQAEALFLGLAKKHGMTLVLRGHDSSKFLFMPIGASGSAFESVERLIVDAPENTVHVNVIRNEEFTRALEKLKVPFTIHDGDERPSLDVWRPTQRFVQIPDVELKEPRASVGEARLFAHIPESNAEREISISLDDAMKHLETAFNLQRSGLDIEPGGQGGRGRRGRSR